MAFAAVKEAHLEVDFILAYFPVPVQKIAYLLVNIIYFVFLVILTGYLFLNAQNAYVKNEISMTSRVPIYPFIFAVAVGMGVNALVVFGKMLQVATDAINGKDVASK